MLVWLTLPFYDFCGFRSVAVMPVNNVYKLQFFTFSHVTPHAPSSSMSDDSDDTDTSLNVGRS